MGDLAFLEAERNWLEQARDKQVMPIDGWSMILAQCGRGWGKTQVGAALVRRWVGLYPGCIIHVVAPTQADLRGTIFNGISGLLAAIPAAMIREIDLSRHEIRFWNDCLLRGFSAEANERLRGPQCTFLWGDEIAAWGLKAEDTMSNIDFSTRIAYRHPDGRLIQPQKFFTTTPKPSTWLKKLGQEADHVIYGSTYENKANLAQDFFDKIARYEGTKIGQQEIHGELLDISEAAIIKRSWINLWPHATALPWFEFIMVSLDTAFTEKTYDKKKSEADPTACTVWGVFPHNKRWNLMLLECWNDLMGLPELIQASKKELRKIYGQKVEQLFKPVIGEAVMLQQTKKPDLLIVEDKGSGISLRQMLAYEGIDSYPYNPGMADKMARLHAVSHVAAAGRIWIPESSLHPGSPRDWTVPLLDEVCVYSGPGTTPHDDWVDSCSQAWRYFADNWLNTGVNEIIKPGGVTVDVPDAMLPEDMARAYQPETRNYYDV